MATQKNKAVGKEPNQTDTNGAPSNMDEDGDVEQEHNDTDTNSVPDDCVVQSLTMESRHMRGSLEMQTVVSAIIHVSSQHETAVGEFPEEYQKKNKDGELETKTRVIKRKYQKVVKPAHMKTVRMVLPGGVTAKKLSELIAGMANW